MKKLYYTNGKLGFDFEDFFITDPFISTCCRFDVDPIKEYGLNKKQVKRFNKIFTNRNRKKKNKMVKSIKIENAKRILEKFDSWKYDIYESNKSDWTKQDDKDVNEIEKLLKQQASEMKGERLK